LQQEFCGLAAPEVVGAAAIYPRYQALTVRKGPFMKHNKAVAAVIGSAAVILLAVPAIVDGAPAPPPVGIVAGNGPYSPFPTPPVTASALVSTSTSTAAAPDNSTGH